ncbi:MAG: GNAT family N-acetyltransferase [Gemmataceae bacterium]|nr:GNAT family N-acetyltransferase [Gemmataceae bacterium]
MFTSAPVLDGRHVRLEPIAEGHRAGLQTSADDPRIWAVTTADAAGPAFDPWFADLLALQAAGTRLTYAVRLLATGEMVGSTSLFDYEPKHRRAEIGWTWYRPDQWGTAVNPECKLLLFAHAFDTMGLNRVQLKTDLLNTRSQAAIAKLGAVREGVLRAHMVVKDGRVRDSVMFSVIREEWPAVRDRLLARLAAYDTGGQVVPPEGR